MYNLKRKQKKIYNSRINGKYNSFISYIKFKYGAIMMKKNCFIKVDHLYIHCSTKYIYIHTAKKLLRKLNVFKK